MTAAHHIPEDKKNPEVGEGKFNDLVYSLETKTFLKFKHFLVMHYMLNANMTITDPLPNLDFETISAEIKKRLPGLDQQALKDTKTWIKEPFRKLDELKEKLKNLLSTHHGEMGTTEIRQNKQQLDEIEKYQSKLKDLIGAFEDYEVKSENTETIRTGTKNKFQQLHLFDKNDADDR